MFKARSQCFAPLVQSPTRIYFSCTRLHSTLAVACTVRLYIYRSATRSSQGQGAHWTVHSSIRTRGHPHTPAQPSRFAGLSKGASVRGRRRAIPYVRPKSTPNSPTQCTLATALPYIIREWSRKNTCDRNSDDARPRLSRQGRQDSSHRDRPDAPST